MILERLSARDFFLKLNSRTMNLVDEFYDEEVYFLDPIVEIKNRSQMRAYYENMYKNVESISWLITDEIMDRHQTVLVWTI